MGDLVNAEQRRTAHERGKERRVQIRNRIGLVVLSAALLWSVVHVARHSLFQRTGTDAGGKVVIRFAHWQLEGRTVEALNEACAEYMRLHPKVIVEQIDVPERGYESWVKTQLIGRTAPDFIELRLWSWKDLMSRYFQPLATFVDQPNPYNKGTELEGVPWQQTFRDNMEGGWVSDLQSQYGIPLTIYTMRIYANRQALEKALGRPLEKDAQGLVIGPKSISEFLLWCDLVRKVEIAPGRFMTPIAGSEYTANMFSWKYWGMATWSLLDVLDRDYDGNLSEAERAEALYTGRFDITKDRYVRAGHEVLFDLSRNFNAGFMSAQRDQSVFLFTQGEAAMIASGSWDAGSLKREISGDFEMVIFDFPTADPADPKYGDIIRHRLTEADTRAGFCFGLTKQTENPKQAIDFMMFLTSRRAEGEHTKQMDFPDRQVDNGTLNNAFMWFPAIKGCKPLPMLEAFSPEPEGVPSGIFQPHFAGDTELRYKNAFTAYISEAKPKPDHYQRFIEAYDHDLRQYALSDIETSLQKLYTSIATNERSLSAARTRLYRADQSGAAPGEAAREYAITLFNQSNQIGAFPGRRRKLAELKDLAAQAAAGKGGP